MTEGSRKMEDRSQETEDRSRKSEVKKNKLNRNDNGSLTGGARGGLTYKY